MFLFDTERGAGVITAPDFDKKQIVFVLFHEGEKLSFSNDNLIVKRKDGSFKLQISCYRLFIVYLVGNCSLTSVVIQKAKKFRFWLALLTSGFRLYSMIGGDKEGNTLLRQKQYRYDGLEIAKHIAQNKIMNQRALLKSIRDKNDCVCEAIVLLAGYCEKAGAAKDLRELMGYEGQASRVYFRNCFNNTVWNGRQPRVKADILNSTLDVGYTLLFSFVDSLLLSFGFDTYRGVMHTQFYMRKSLTCDMVEPFRVLIDQQIRKAVNFRQLQEEDFILVNRQYRLRWESSAKYVKLLMTPILENKGRIFLYFQEYYRCFMKELSSERFPVFSLEVYHDNHQL